MFGRLKKLFGENRFALIALLFSLLDIGYYFLLISFKIEEKQATYEAVTSLILISFFSFILQRIHTYYHSRSAINIVHISIIFIFSLLSTLFLQKYGSWIGADTPIYLTFLNSSFYIRWFILFLVFLTVVNQLWIDKHLTEQANAFNRLIEKERQLAKSEITNLHQQFQPHFLFNSLNSISALIKSQPDNARNMIHNLSDYLRLTIQKSKDDFISIKDELDYLNLYLSIEKIRFGHRLSIQIDVQDECKEMQLPSLLLQPIVENAIKYGLYGNVGDLIISIFITCDNNNLQIIVSNPFDETSVSSTKGTGYGLESINRKLSFLYKRNDLLKIIKSENQFSAQLLIPQK
jgi:sensor histidine kinase YesM